MIVIMIMMIIINIIIIIVQISDLSFSIGYERLIEESSASERTEVLLGLTLTMLVLLVLATVC